MRTAGSEKIVHGPDGTTWIVRGNDDGTYTAWRCELTEGPTCRRSWQAVQAAQNGLSSPVPGEVSRG